MNPQKRTCSIEEHHADPAIGSSLLKILIRQSPAHYLWAKEHPEQPTPAQAFGTAIHAAILEPTRFFENVVEEPKFSGTGSRAAKEEWHLENHGKIIMKPEQYLDVRGILKAVSSHKQASKLISEGHAEESFFWIDPETGIPCKGRIDFKHDRHIIVDVKSTENASEDEFKAQIAQYGYHMQAAHYLEGASLVYGHDFDDFVIIACEKNPPYGVNCFTLGIETLDEGRALRHKALKRLQECQRTGLYPCYDDSKIHPIGLPSWAYKQEGF